MNEETKEKFDEWALLELFGHQKVAGKVTECSIAGGAFLRIDIPAINGSQACTRYFSPGSIYSINPVTEAVARGLLTQSRFRNEPVSRFDLPQIAEKVEETTPGTAGDTLIWCPDCHELMDNCRCGEEHDDR
jgi:hypothetical protein